MKDSKEDIIRGKFAYAYEHPRLKSVWTEGSDRRIGRELRLSLRVGVVGPSLSCLTGMTDNNDWSHSCELGLAEITIGVPNGGIRHQSPHCKIGNNAVRVLEEDARDLGLKPDDVVVYEVEFLADPGGQHKPIRLARRIIPVNQTAPYAGDPMPDYALQYLNQRLFDSIFNH